MPDNWELGIAKRIMNKIIYGKDWDFWRRVDNAHQEEKDYTAKNRQEYE